MPATNVTPVQSFSALKRIKLLVRNAETGTQFNHRVMLFVHCDKTDQPNLVELVMDSIGGNQTKL